MHRRASTWQDNHSNYANHSNSNNTDNCHQGYRDVTHSLGWRLQGGHKVQLSQQQLTVSKSVSISSEWPWLFASTVASILFMPHRMHNVHNAAYCDDDPVAWHASLCVTRLHCANFGSDGDPVRSRLETFGTHGTLYFDMGYNPIRQKRGLTVNSFSRQVRVGRWNLCSLTYSLT